MPEPTPRLFSDDGDEAGAVISDCGRYRYRLWRQWRYPQPPAVAFVMLNPSTADATQDDPTIRRCRGFAKSWGFGRLEVVNLCAYRATDPTDLWDADEPTGPGNDAHILEVCRSVEQVVCAWGNHAPWPRAREVIGLLVDNHVPLHVLCFTKLGNPAHPLRLRADLQPRPWGH